MFVNESEVIVRSIKNRFSSFDFFPKLGRSSENDQKPNQNKRQIRIEKIFIRRSTLITQPHIRWVHFYIPAEKNMQHTKITFFIVKIKGSCPAPHVGTFFKGSPDQSHFIFEINVGKRRIRPRTTLKLNS